MVASAVPLTRESRKMIGERQFAMMKPGVILINVSRGGVVDTDALVEGSTASESPRQGLT